MELLKIYFDVFVVFLLCAGMAKGQFIPQQEPFPPQQPFLQQQQPFQQQQQPFLQQQQPFQQQQRPFQQQQPFLQQQQPFQSQQQQPFQLQQQRPFQQQQPFAQQQKQFPFIPQPPVTSGGFSPQDLINNPMEVLKKLTNSQDPLNIPKNTRPNPFSPPNFRPNRPNPFRNLFSPNNFEPKIFPPRNSEPVPLPPQNSNLNGPQNPVWNPPNIPGYTLGGPQNSNPNPFAPPPPNINGPQNPDSTPFILPNLNPPQNSNPSPFIPQDSSPSSFNPQDSNPIPFNPQDSSPIPFNPQDSSPIPFNPQDSDLNGPQDSEPSSSVPQENDSNSPEDSDSTTANSQTTDEPQNVSDSGIQDASGTGSQDSSDSGVQRSSPDLTSDSQTPRKGRRIADIHRFGEKFFPLRSRFRPRFGPNSPRRRRPLSDSLGRFRIVCLFNNLHYYRGEFTPGLLNPHLCTHLNYEFAILDPKTYEIMVGEPKLDTEKNFYQEAIDLKKINRKLKVLLSLGGWNDSTKKYSELAAAEDKWDNFITKTIDFLKSHEFDGLDFAWEYPNCWQGAIGVSPKDKKNFVNLLRAMKPKFEANNLLLSVSVGAIKREIEAAYECKDISDTVDYINVMTYDMHGPWEPITGHHTQFCPKDGDMDPDANVQSGLQAWIDKGADKTKLNMGIAMYGRTFTMAGDVCEMGAPSIGMGKPGNSSTEGGFLLYNEICYNLNKNGWTEKEDEAGFYACSGDQFACYDPPMMMVKKAKYVVDEGLGGLLMKDLSGEDFRGECFNMSFPLLKMAKLEMVQRIRRLGLV